jgi:hypothetical protein
MRCGQQVEVIDVYGACTVRLIAQCEGRFLLISHSWDRLNGMYLPDWHSALRELITLAVPGRMTEKIQRARSAASGLYVDIPLAYPLSAKGLADLLMADEAEVRAQLADLAVMMDG